MSKNYSGTVLIIIAFLGWGFTPLYFNSVAQVSPFEIVAHRIIWSIVFLIIITITKNQFHKIIEILKSPRYLFILICTALLISSNWLIFIWAVLNKHLIEGSLGYFISPIFSILLGMVFLNEKIYSAQKISLLITIVAVFFQFSEISFKGFTPYIPILLAASFGFYSLLRKRIKIESIHGLTVETFILSPIALIYLIYLSLNHKLSFFISPKISCLLMFAGILTSAPLILYVSGCKLLPLSKVGFYEYIRPSVQLMIAVFIFNEKINTNKLISFCLVWLSLVIYILNNIWISYRNKGVTNQI